MAYVKRHKVLWGIFCKKEREDSELFLLSSVVVSVGEERGGGNKRSGKKTQKTQSGTYTHTHTHDFCRKKKRDFEKCDKTLHS